MPSRAGLEHRGFWLSLSEPAQQVRAADDADDATVTDHGDTLDAMGRQQARDFADCGFLGDRHHRRRHDLARCALGRAQVREIIGVELGRVGEERQPPIASGCGSQPGEITRLVSGRENRRRGVARRFLSADQIALAQDVMTAKVAAVSPDTPANKISGLLLENGITAIPVVDGTGAPIGMVNGARSSSGSWTRPARCFSIYGARSWSVIEQRYRVP